MLNRNSSKRIASIRDVSRYRPSYLGTPVQRSYLCYSRRGRTGSSHVSNHTVDKGSIALVAQALLSSAVHSATSRRAAHPHGCREDGCTVWRQARTHLLPQVFTAQLLHTRMKTKNKPLYCLSCGTHQYLSPLGSIEDTAVQMHLLPPT